MYVTQLGKRLAIMYNIESILEVVWINGGQKRVEIGDEQFFKSKSYL